MTKEMPYPIIKTVYIFRNFFTVNRRPIPPKPKFAVDLMGRLPHLFTETLFTIL